MVRRGAADKLPSAPIKSDGDLMSRHYIISQSADICEEETKGRKEKRAKTGADGKLHGTGGWQKPQEQWIYK